MALLTGVGRIKLLGLVPIQPSAPLVVAGVLCCVLIAGSAQTREANVSSPPATSYQVGSFELQESGPPQKVSGASVTPTFFETAKTRTFLGRGFIPEDYGSGGSGIVILSHRLWQQRFGGAPQVIGSTIRLNGKGFTVIGVMPPTFDVPSGVDIWLPKKLFWVPDDLRDAKIVLGHDRFSKELVFTQADLGLITDFEERPNHELIVVGQNGAVFIKDGNSLINTSISFNKNEGIHGRCVSSVVGVELGVGSFLCRGGWGTNVELFDAAGKTLWSYGGGLSAGLSAIDNAAAGTLGPNATPSVVVGFNGDGGIRRLSAEGIELWKQSDGNVWHVEIVADDKSGNVILHSNAKGQLTMRDANGNVLGRYDPEIYLAKFAMTTWGDDPDRKKLVASAKGSIYVLSTDGKTVARLPAPGSCKQHGCTGMADPKGTRVRFSARAPYFAGLLRYFLWTRSLLYIYDSGNQLVYHEILDHNCDALHATPDENGVENLFVGCEGTVLKYSQNHD